MKEIHLHGLGVKHTIWEKAWRCEEHGSGVFGEMQRVGKDEKALTGWNFLLSVQVLS